ncbi:MAG: hypothetical protein PW788_02475 [Micavibrio sp.]|nr:hypothetical protein [Micavibrio sp.]
MTMRHFCKVFAFAAIFLMVGAHDAHAGTKLGDVITNVTKSWGGFNNVLSTVAWLSGAFLGVAAVFKFKDHVDNPAQHPLSAGVKRMVAGGMMLSLPFMIKAVNGSLFGANGTNGKVKVTGFNTATLSAGGLDKMVVDVMSNIAGPIETLLVAFSYLAGTALLLVGISRLTKRMEEGPRGPAGFGTIMTFISSGMLFNYGAAMGGFASTIFGDASLMSKITIDPTVINNADDAGKVQYVLEGLEVFVIIVGYIAFLRGWFVLKNFADGQQGATLAQGLTFLFGGAVAINMGEFVNAITQTIGVTGLTFS